MKYVQKNSPFGVSEGAFNQLNQLWKKITLKKELYLFVGQYYGNALAWFRLFDESRKNRDEVRKKRHNYQPFRALTAAKAKIAAVSVLNLASPNETMRYEEFCIWQISSSVKSPSGPIRIRNLS